MAKALARLSLITPKRRWFQFNLRTLFGVVAAAAVALWLIPHRWPPAQVWFVRHRLTKAVHDGDHAAFEEAIGAIERLQGTGPEKGYKWRRAGFAYRLVMAESTSDELLASLSHSSADSRLLAAIGLGLVRPGDRNVIPDLVVALRDEDDRVRQAACFALPQFGTLAKPAIPAIRELCEAPAKGATHLAAHEALIDLQGLGGRVHYWRSGPLSASAKDHAVYFLERIDPRRGHLDFYRTRRTELSALLIELRNELASLDDGELRGKRMPEVRELERTLREIDKQIRRAEIASQ